MDPWGPLPPGVYAPGGVFTYMMPDHDQQLQALPLPLPLPLPFHPGGSQSGTSRHGSGHMGSRVRLPPRPSRLSSAHRVSRPPDSSTPLNPSGSASLQSPTSGNSPRPRRRRRRSSSQSHPPPLTNASSQPHHHRRRRRRRTRTRSERSTSHSPRGRRRSTRSNRSRRTLPPLTEEEITLHAPNDDNREAQTHHSSPRLSSSSTAAAAAAAAVSRRSTTPPPPPPPDSTNNTNNSNTSYHTALPFLLSDHNTPLTDPIFRQAEASRVMAGESPEAFTREEERVLYDFMMRARRPLTLPEAGREADWRFGRDFSGLGWGDY